MQGELWEGLISHMRRMGLEYLPRFTYHKFEPNVGKNIPYMEHLGFWSPVTLFVIFSKHKNHEIIHNFNLLMITLTSPFHQAPIRIDVDSCLETKNETQGSKTKVSTALVLGGSDGTPLEAMSWVPFPFLKRRFNLGSLFRLNMWTS